MNYQSIIGLLICLLPVYTMAAEPSSASAPELLNSFVITGLVVDAETNKPVAGAEIGYLNRLASVRSDTAGRFSLILKSTDPVGLIIDHSDYVYQHLDAVQPSQELQVKLKPKKQSLATQRWLAYLQKNSFKFKFDKIPGWSLSFKQRKLSGDLKPDKTIIRRDPSAVIKVDGLYYVWYSLSRGPSYGFFSGDLTAKTYPWDYSDIYYATSKDGYSWQERGPAVLRGQPGAFDDRSVFTPEILKHQEKFYLVYQAVQAPYLNRTKNTVAMAWADSPRGPWTKLAEPILHAANNGVWDPATQSNDDALKQGDFDSQKVHDPTLFFYKNKFYLYYKGERMGERRYMGQRDIKWGVAIADHAFGPYVKSQYNPLTNTGHELVIWQYRDGIALINTLDGPERGTVQFARDGLNFELMGRAKHIPHAQGLFRDEQLGEDPLDGVAWGLSHVMVWRNIKGGWMYINRFDATKRH